MEFSFHRISFISALAGLPFSADRDRLPPGLGTTGRRLMQPPMGHDSNPHRGALAPTNSASSHHQNPVGSLPGAEAEGPGLG